MLFQQIPVDGLLPVRRLHLTAHGYDFFRAALDVETLLAAGLVEAAGEGLLGFVGDYRQLLVIVAGIGNRQVQFFGHHQKCHVDDITFGNPLAAGVIELAFIGENARNAELPEVAPVIVSLYFATRRHTFAGELKAALIGQQRLANSQFIHRQGAGLIRADKSTGAQRFHGHQLADNDVDLGHAPHTDSQGHGQRGGQSFRYDRHRQADRHHGHRLDAVAAAQQHDTHQQQDGHHNGAGHLVGEPPDADHQRGFTGAFAADTAGDGAQLGCQPGGGYLASAAPAGDHGARKALVDAFGQRRLFGHRRLGVLGDRQGFPGQHGFVDGQILGAQQCDIGGHLVAAAQQHDIPRHDLLDIQLHHLAVAQHPAIALHHAAQGGRTFLCRKFLDGTDGGIEQQYQNDKNAAGILSQPERHQCGDRQYVDKGAQKLAREYP